MTRVQAAELRKQFIEQRQEILQRKVSSIENKLYEAILNKLIDELDKSGGKIVSNNKNIDLTTAIDKIFNGINSTDYLDVIRSFSKDLQGIQDLNKTYFEIIENDQIKLKSVSRQVNLDMRKRIGLNTKGDLVKDGYLDRLIKDDALLKKVKNETYRSITREVSLTEYRNKIKRIIVGNEKVDGGLVRHFKTFAMDTYNQFDSTTQKLYAQKLNLQAFVYSGGLINTSREFCRERNGQVFTVKEAQAWKKEDFDGKPDNYDPIIDRGGYGCRHDLNFISNSEAIRRRPELDLAL